MNWNDHKYFPLVFNFRYMSFFSYQRPTFGSVGWYVILLIYLFLIKWKLRALLFLYILFFFALIFVSLATTTWAVFFFVNFNLGRFDFVFCFWVFHVLSSHKQVRNFIYFNVFVWNFFVWSFPMNDEVDWIVIDIDFYLSWVCDCDVGYEVLSFFFMDMIVALIDEKCWFLLRFGLINFFLALKFIFLVFVHGYVMKAIWLMFVVLSAFAFGLGWSVHEFWSFATVGFKVEVCWVFVFLW